jgi:aminoglycoside phosphotransferase family enzyme/predicted kinase
VETPISAVFVGQHTTWKLRKAVRLNFLDFTTVEGRGKAALRELEINTPNAPGLYHDVMPITQGGSGLELGGTGCVVDWVVRMARVPEADFLDALAAKGGLSPELLLATADAVAEMHLRLPPAEKDGPSALLRVIESNRISGLESGLPPARITDWYLAMLRKLDACRPWLIARGQDGFIRRTHGDLHLGNLCLWHGAPVAFDAIEFSETMATIDLGYDLAFLLMDLCVRADNAAATLVLNRYVARTGDVGLLMGLPMFLSMRALVRAHVSCKGGKPWGEYLGFAEAALDRPQPVVVGIGGLPGSGKSTLARGLAPWLSPFPGALVLRSDEVRKRLHGVKPEQKLPKSAYTPQVSRAVMTEVFNGVATAARANHSVIADMTFMNAKDRAALKRAAGIVPCSGVWLQAPLAVLEARVAARVGDASDADLAVLRSAAAGDPGPGEWTALDATAPDALAQLARLVTDAASTC